MRMKLQKKCATCYPFFLRCYYYSDVGSFATKIDAPDINQTVVERSCSGILLCSLGLSCFERKSLMSIKYKLFICLDLELSSFKQVSIDVSPTTKLILRFTKTVDGIGKIFLQNMQVHGNFSQVVSTIYIEYRICTKFIFR